MRQWIGWSVILTVFVGAVSATYSQEAFDIGASLQPDFSEIALLPTRLTYYNMHEDSAIATYTCCKPDQEEDIRKALAANAGFLENWADTDFADDTLMHNARVNSVKGDFRHQIEALADLVDYYPDSDLADDGLYHLGRLYVRDRDHEMAIRVFDVLVTRWPDSVWADDALMNLARQLRQLDDERGALAALDELATYYPDSDHCAYALNSLAQQAMEDEDYASAIEISDVILHRYNASDYADEAQLRIAEALRHSDDAGGALDAYVDLIERLPGSRLSNRAMREANSIARRMRFSNSEADGLPLYDTRDQNPGKDAEELYYLAKHFENYHEFASAIDTYHEFVETYPGSDHYDDALYNIGACYQKMNILFQDINQAKGPEDLFRLQDEWEDATGAYGTLPTPGDLSAVGDATSAFALVVNNLVGSSLRDDALYQIAKSFEDSNMTADMAYTYQELLIHFPSSEYHFEALMEVLDFYTDPHNWEAAQTMYPALAAAYPGHFPLWLIENRLNFYTIMRAYNDHAQFAWFESHDHHIPYHFTIADLSFDADFYRAALFMSGGRYSDAFKLLEPLAQMPTNDFCVRAKWLLGRGYEATGSSSRARGYYNDIIQHHPRSGLADDTHLALERMEAESDDLDTCRSKVEERVGQSVEHFDSYLGENVVVFAPYTVTARMRLYNMPNIWENAQEILSDWTGVEQSERIVVYVDPNNTLRRGDPIHVPARLIKDPPKWSLGLEQIAHGTIQQALAGTSSKESGMLIKGISQFASASLQYDLVTETRDAIGSAAAVKLPQEEVRKTREKALERLSEYVRQGAEPDDIDPQVVCGMMFKLLDVEGYSQDQLIDREPYRKVFQWLKENAGSADVKGFASAVNVAFDGAVTEQLRQWNLPVDTRAVQKMQ
ncbi:MAG: tetratricopeptide repeat protein [Armatimonadota bacterium]